MWAAELFSLRRAEARVRTYGAARAERVRLHFFAAEQRLRAGRREIRAVPAALLLRDAVREYLLAMSAAEGIVAADALGPPSLDLPALSPDPACPRAEPSDDLRVRAALAARDPLYFDTLAAADVERTRRALARAGAMLRRRVEARTLTRLRVERWGRVAAAALTIACVAFFAVSSAFGAPDIALGKPMRLSRHTHIPTTEGKDDGTEEDPNAIIDLLAVYRLDRVEVHNRVDGWFGDCLPLVVEISKDGITYEPIGRRESYFGNRPPWIVYAQGRSARYVRVRVDRRGYLGLAKIEVFGKRE